MTAEKVKVESREIINKLDYGCSQTSEQDEASFERRRREPPGGSEGMPLQKILKSKRLRNALLSISRGIFLQKSQSWAKIKTRQLPRLASC